uniref:Uncharacterized protein n=1 Tax=Sphaerodactylus townsendi TaxID=933632 RepID=A0ACB8G3M7_9SAUR
MNCGKKSLAMLSAGIEEAAPDWKYPSGQQLAIEVPGPGTEIDSSPSYPVKPQTIIRPGGALSHYIHKMADCRLSISEQVEPHSLMNYQQCLVHAQADMSLATTRATANSTASKENHDLPKFTFQIGKYELQ